MKTLTVNVTAEHIAAGIPGEDCQCAVALAFAPLVKSNAVARVYDGDAYIYPEDTLPRPRPAIVQLPAHVDRLIYDFDKGRSVEPFSFEIEMYDSDWRRIRPAKEAA